MESIIKWLQMHLVKALPEWDLSPLAGKERGKLRLSPEQLLQVIHAQALAEWSLAMAHRFSRLRLERRRAGAPLKYRDSSVLLMAMVQSVWRKSYEKIVRWGFCPSCSSFWAWRGSWWAWGSSPVGN